MLSISALNYIMSKANCSEGHRFECGSGTGLPALPLQIESSSSWILFYSRLFIFPSHSTFPLTLQLKSK